MKKFFFIALLGLVFSCQKEEIKPIVLPEGEQAALTDKSRSPMSVSNGQETEGETTGTITDPNSDRDGNSRKRN